MRNPPNLVWLRSFEAAARHLNFTVAAAELGITQTAVSLHIRSLEAALGHRVFTRAARRLTLTDAGMAYATTVSRALGEIALSTATLFGASTERVLTVRVPLSTAVFSLVGRLPQFTRAHPGVAIRLVSNIWSAASGPHDVDVELRLGKGNWPNVTARRISREALILIAPAGENNVHSLPLIQILGLEDMWLRLVEARGQTHSDTAGAVATLTVDTTVAAMEIVAAGGGHAVVLERFARAAIAAGRPVRCLGEPLPVEEAHYLVRADRPSIDDTALQLFEAWLERVFNPDAGS